MRRLLLNSITWILIASGAFYFVHGGLDYLESKKAQDAIASQWNSEQGVNSGLSDDTDVTRPPAVAEPRREAPPPYWYSEIALHCSTPSRRCDCASFHSTAGCHFVRGGRTMIHRDLKRGPGHLIGTAMPGQDGNCVIAGHRDTHFRVLKNIQKGDEMLLTRNGRNMALPSG